MNTKKKDLLDELTKLKNQLVELDNSKHSLEIAETDVKNAKTFCPMNLKNFDDEEKEKYIESVVGTEPKKPSKWLIGKKKKYEEELKCYNESKEAAKNEYEEKFADIRKELDEKDNAEYDDRLSKAKESEKKAKERLKAAEKDIEENDFLGPDMKNNETINLLYGYVINNRAETIKEAVQLYFVEKRIEESQKKDAEFKEQALKRIDEGVEEITRRITEKINDMSDEVIRNLNNSVKDISDNLESIYDTVNSTISDFENVINYAESTIDGIDTYKFDSFISDAEEKIEDFVYNAKSKIDDFTQN